MPMTTRQMADAEAMWAKGVSVKRIAQALGVSETCVRNTAYLHRDRFPRRSANGAPRKLDYELAYRLHGMTLRELRGIGHRWFAGCLGGASTKAQVVDEMVSQLRHWWHLPDGYGRQRVANVLRDIDAVWKEG